MTNLNLKNKLIIFLTSSLTACASSSYKIQNQTENRIEFLLTSDRILLECQSLDDPEKSFGFMIHILDDEKTVLTAIQGNKIDQESCNERIKKIGLILGKGERIYFGAMGDVVEPRQRLEPKYTFPSHGTFYSNGRSLQFSVIANELGMCYDAYTGPEKPCPRGQFPIKFKK